MAGGPIVPAAYPVDATCFPEFDPNHQYMGLAVAGATIDGVSDVIWRLTFAIPEVLPSGTPKLDLLAEANSTSQVIRVEFLWVAQAKTVILSTAKVSEGEQNITLSGTANTPVSTKITLDATTVPAASQILLADLKFHGTDAAWTANVNVITWPYLIWE